MWYHKSKNWAILDFKTHAKSKIGKNLLHFNLLQPDVCHFFSLLRPQFWIRTFCNMAVSFEHSWFCFFSKFDTPSMKIFLRSEKKLTNTKKKYSQNWHAVNIEIGMGFENCWKIKNPFFLHSKTMISIFRKTSISVFYRGKIENMPWYILVVLGLRKKYMRTFC